MKPKTTLVVSKVTPKGVLTKINFALSKLVTSIGTIGADIMLKEATTLQAVLIVDTINNPSGIMFNRGEVGSLYVNGQPINKNMTYPITARDLIQILDHFLYLTYGKPEESDKDIVLQKMKVGKRKSISSTPIKRDSITVRRSQEQRTSIKKLVSEDNPKEFKNEDNDFNVNFSLLSSVIPEEIEIDNANDSKVESGGTKEDLRRKKVEKVRKPRKRSQSREARRETCEIEELKDEEKKEVVIRVSQQKGNVKSIISETDFLKGKVFYFGMNDEMMKKYEHIIKKYGGKVGDRYPKFDKALLPTKAELDAFKKEEKGEELFHKWGVNGPKECALVVSKENEGPHMAYLCCIVSQVPVIRSDYFDQIAKQKKDVGMFNFLAPVIPTSTGVFANSVQPIEFFPFETYNINEVPRIQIPAKKSESEKNITETFIVKVGCRVVDRTITRKSELKPTGLDKSVYSFSPIMESEVKKNRMSMGTQRKSEAQQDFLVLYLDWVVKMILDGGFIAPRDYILNKDVDGYDQI
ncbi:hypothetical protein EIN_118130 [Entamoeba invadens IP1]|uniref:BRCT domain-containing protein n=1 Tax=Entamoeba invadens IP1 TaxID=370355 RepID=L7FNI7_ENTIV|nr:hypothetical protein EIN_118130 [Entamoeba invadens IP1]ELP92239.1 hypothetical protein EIN_118130 [Entamoeba invadens IP1]|eukprot:XP_004259010.1 hypothetical protein EIN_118130 [Entamoeba invadens IP1]